MTEENLYYPKYERVMVAVFTENNDEKRKYFNLFKFMLKDKIEKMINTKDRKEFVIDKLHFKFLPKSLNSKGHKAHYILNLTQDVEFNNEVAMPITSIHYYLTKDNDWAELFE